MVKKSKSRGRYQGGLDPEKPAKTLSDYENLGETRNKCHGTRVRKMLLYIHSDIEFFFFLGSCNNGLNGQESQTCSIDRRKIFINSKHLNTI